MSTPNSDPPTLPGRALDKPAVPTRSTDETLAGLTLTGGPASGGGPAGAAALPAAVPPAATPPSELPPPLPPAGGGPPTAGPPAPLHAPGSNYSLPILIGVFILAVVGI